MGTDNNQDLQALMTYFDKLTKFIQNNCDFSFGNKKLYNKKKLDDVLCCIEANFPPLFKKYLNEYGVNKQIKTFLLKDQLIENIRIKPPIGNSSYFVNTNETLDLIAKLKKSIPSDYNYIVANFPALL